METMVILKGVAMILVFVIAVALMMTKKLPTIIALPTMAILFSLIAGVPLMSDDPEQVTILKSVLQQGASRMADPMIGLIFGALFAQVLNKLSITKSIVKKAAELGGDKPLACSLIFFIAASIIFMAGNGLGMVILVGNIIIPIMITTGVSAFNAGLITLLSCSVGGMLNVTSWPMYVQTLGVTMSDVRTYVWIAFIPFVILCFFLIVFRIKADQGKRKAWAMPNNDDLGAAQKQVPIISYLAPVIPVILVFALKMDIVPAVIIAVIVALVIVRPKRPIHIVSSSLVEGIQDVAGAIALFIGIGMLLIAVSTPQVGAVLQPLIEMIVPSSTIGYIAFFVILAPFAIYRGPMNMFGLGAGVSALLVTAGLNPVAIMIGMQAIGNVQGVCDPTNSSTVWISDFTKTEVTDYLKKTILWVLLAVAVSMIVGMPIILN